MIMKKKKKEERKKKRIGINGNRVDFILVFYQKKNFLDYMTVSRDISREQRQREKEIIKKTLITNITDKNTKKRANNNSVKVFELSFFRNRFDNRDLSLKD